MVPAAQHLSTLRAEAAALRERSRKEREDALRSEAAGLEDNIRRITAQVLGQIYRIPAQEVTALKEQAEAHKEELLHIFHQLRESEVENVLEKSDQSVLCHLTLTLMRDPVVAADGYTYDRSSFERWIERERSVGRGRAGAARSPITNAVLQHLSVVPHHHLRAQILDKVKSGVAGEECERKAARVFADKEIQALGEMEDETSSIQTLLNAMRRFAHDPEIQIRSCLSLCKLTIGNDDNKRAVASLGGVQIIIDSMQLHPTNSAVQRRAISVLGNLASLAENRGLITQLGGIQHTIAAWNAHNCKLGASAPQCPLPPTTISPRSPSDPLSHGVVNPCSGLVNSVCCETLGNLAADCSSACSEVAARGGIELIVAGMHAHSTYTAYQKAACSALASLAFNHHINQTHIASCGGVRYILVSMRSHAHRHDVLSSAMRALDALTYQHWDNTREVPNPEP
jgi:hypothetical protein